MRLRIDGAKTDRLVGDEIPVHAQLHTIDGFSARAGQRASLAWQQRRARRGLVWCAAITSPLGEGENGTDRREDGGEDSGNSHPSVSPYRCSERHGMRWVGSQTSLTLLRPRRVMRRHRVTRSIPSSRATALRLLACF